MILTESNPVFKVTAFLKSNISKTVHFYRATLCVSLVFAVARCLSVGLSICPARWCIVSTRLKISSNFFLDPIVPSF